MVSAASMRPCLPPEMMAVSVAFGREMTAVPARKITHLRWIRCQFTGYVDAYGEERVIKCSREVNSLDCWRVVQAPIESSWNDAKTRHISVSELCDNSARDAGCRGRNERSFHLPAFQGRFVPRIATNCGDVQQLRDSTGCGDSAHENLWE